MKRHDKHDEKSQHQQTEVKSTDTKRKKKKDGVLRKLQALLLCALFIAVLGPVTFYRFDNYNSTFSGFNNSTSSRLSSSWQPPPPVATSARSPALTTSVAVSASGVNNSTSSRAPLRRPLWLTDYPELPAWTKDYFNWHVKQRIIIDNAKNISDLPDGMTFLVIQCTGEKYINCGGIADRLRPLPFFIFVAARAEFVLLARWEKPCALEHFLVPPPRGVGIDWRVPNWMANHIHRGIDLKNVNDGKKYIQNANHTSIIGRKRRTERVKFVTARMQVIDAGSLYYNEQNDRRRDENSFEVVFRGMFRTLFAPAPALDSLLRRQLTEMRLAPGEYVGVHVRARYPPQVSIDKVKRIRRTVIDKEGGLPFEGDLRRAIVTVATNAIHCAIRAMPNASIYFASDSDQLVDYMTTSSPFVVDGIVDIVSQKHQVEPIHLDTKLWANHTPGDFYPAFLDLWLLGGSRCTIFGRGGFGKIANSLSYNSFCYVSHRNWEGRISPCPSVLPKEVWDAEEAINWYNRGATSGGWWDVVW